MRLTRKLKRLLTKISYSIPLRIVLVAPFIVLIVAIVILVGWLSFRNGQKAVVNLASQLQSEVTTHIYQNLDTYLNQPHWLTQTSVDAIRVGLLELTNLAVLERHLWRQLQQIETISRVAFISRQGEYLSVSKLPKSNSVVLEVANQATPGRLELWELDSHGQRQRLLNTTNDNPQLFPWYKTAVAAHKRGWSDIYLDNYYVSTDLTTFKKLSNLSSTAPVDPLSTVAPAKNFPSFRDLENLGLIQTRPVISAYYPIYDQQGDLLGVFSATVPLATVSQFLKTLTINEMPGQTTFILDPTGLLIAASADSGSAAPATVISSANNNRLNSAFHSTHGLTRANVEYLLKKFGNLAQIKNSKRLNFVYQNVRYFFQISPFTDRYGLNWLIIVAVPNTAFMERIHENREFTVLLALAALVIAILFGWKTSQWIIQPLLRLNTVAKEFTERVKTERFDNTTLFSGPDSVMVMPTELDQLANSFTRMAKQLQTLFTSLEAKNEDLRHLNKLKDEFLANTSHELRTPLNGVIGIAESLYDGSTGPLPAETRSNLNMVIASGKRLATLIEDILNFSHKEKKIELNITTVNLHEIVQIVLNLSRPLVNKKRLQLINKVSPNLPPVAVDSDRLQQILLNLVGNAIKFTESGSVEISAGLDFKGKEKKWLAVTVADTGIGIPSDKTAQIFEPFQQLEGYPTTNAQYGGTGLGLAVTKQLIRLHEGCDIKVQSIVGEGSRFTFTLPVATVKLDSKDTVAINHQPVIANSSPGALTNQGQSTTLPLKQELSRPLSVSASPRAKLVTPSTNQTISALANEGVTNLTVAEVISVSTMTDSSTLAASEQFLLPVIKSESTDPNNFMILIVDDEPVNLHVLVNHLSLHHYLVTQASSGLEALTMLENGLVPDLILLDVMMPYMTGYEVTKQIREHWKASELPILLLTAKNQEIDLITGLEVGANDYLIKPVSKNELLARIKTHIRIKQLKAETLQLTLESERRLKQFLEAVPVGVFVMDTQGHPYYANQRAQELLGKGLLTDTGAEDFAQIYQLYLAGSEQLYPLNRLPSLCALQGQAASVDDMEIRWNGKVIPIEVWGTPIVNNEGKLSYAMLAFQDITERRKAEAERIQYADKLFELNQELENYLHTLEEKVEERTHELKESERMLADAQRMALLGSWFWDIKTGTVQRSEQDCRNFHEPPNHYTSTYEAFIEHIHPEDKDIMGAMVEKCIIEGSTAEVEFRVIWPDSQIRTMRSQAELELDLASTPIRLKGFTQDITERKRIETALQDQFQFMEDMLQAIPNPLFYKNCQGRYQGCNRAFEEFTGWNKSTIIGKTVFELWPPEVAKIIYEHDLTLLQQPGIQVYEFKMPYVDGTYHHIISHKATYTNAAGEVIGLVGVITDINERKRTEEALRLAQFSLDRSADGILWTKLDGYHIYANDALCAALGYSREELLSMNIVQIEPHSSFATWEQRWQEYKQHGFMTFETLYCRKDGSVFPVEITKNYLEYQDKEYLCAFIRDITERKQAEEKLQQAKQAAEDALQQLRDTQQQLIEAAKMAELGNLVAGVAHEINTPIGIGVTAASRLDTLTHELSELYHSNRMKRPDLEKYLTSTLRGSDLILKNLTRAAELIQSFKQVAVDQTGDHQRTFNLKNYLTEILTSLRPELKRTKHQIAVECNEEIVLHSYPGVYYQIVTNLVMNSMIHGFRDKPEGSITIVATLTRGDDFKLKKDSVTAHSLWLTLNYTDDGRGIPAEVLPKIFDPFFTTNRQGGGSGLGLHIVYNLVTHKLSGVIHCESVVGQGTTFRMQIPVSEG